MSNPIIDTTVALLERLDDGTRTAAEDSVRAHSREVLGQEVDLEADLNLIKAAKFVAAADGLSAVELRGMKMMMGSFGLPEAVQWHLLEFDESTVESTHVGELAPDGGREARFLLSAILHFAALDGLSDDEAARGREVGAALGQRDNLIEALILEARAEHHAARRRDEHQRKLLRDLRLALLDLDG
ncbi:hypothetical protein G6O69_14415 [Pseudenhygromyxa sp. WMMC2535]|uniref:hypothetical protein n=1 Tax=Pseudenhygromyxa sp. WMMC2535 TaxID=2712867 RepID=UPI001553C502|nr:hypothetical protein [Pseudenhygromyxa sp. WMMC2535]NVB39033.1 hypothetical protein [Pseudenhygromyxa sp. WMMC2535]